jgi:arylsulfatase
MFAKIRSIALLSVLALAWMPLLDAADKPNILVIWGDDVGISNISYNSRGMKSPISVTTHEV